VRRVYLDHNATTHTHLEVVKAMLPFFNERFGNPSSIHSFGQEAKHAMEEARETVASALGAKKDEIVFTSGGTEADNIAVTGVASALCGKGRHIITSKIEHHAVLSTCEHLAGIGFDVTRIPCDADGIVDADAVRKAVRRDTILITIMQANNETGALQPVEEIGKTAMECGVLFHSDAVQALGKVPVDVNRLGVNLLSISSHKIYGPKGVGALYVRRGTPLAPIVFGGHHERKRRPGTENVTGIIGFGRAVELACQNLQAKQVRMLHLRKRLEEGLLSTIPHVRLNGHPTKRLPSTANFCFEFIEGESLVLSLDMEGVAVSSGSACTSGSSDPSHVLLAMGIPPATAQGSVRFSLGSENSEADIDYVLEVLPRIVERLRAMSPLFRQSETCIGEGAAG
jgi:cysteine desulfurase